MTATTKRRGAAKQLSLAREPVKAADPEGATSNESIDMATDTRL
jgi:hypothetical protein